MLEIPDIGPEGEEGGVFEFLGFRDGRRLFSGHWASEKERSPKKSNRPIFTEFELNPQVVANNRLAR